MAHPDTRGAHAPERQIDVVGRRVIAELRRDLTDLRKARLGTDGEAHHHVGVADDVFGAGDDRDVDAELERLIEERRGPGVVEHGGDAPRLRDRHDRRYVLHLEGDRARTLEIDHLGIVAQERGDAGADHWVVECGLDAEALQESTAEGAHGSVDGVDHEHVVAGLHEAEDGCIAGGCTRAIGDCPVAALERGHGILECEGGGRAVAAVAHDALLEAALLALLKVRHVRMQDGRGVINGRVHHSEIRVRIGSGMGE